MSRSSSYSWMPGWLRKFLNLDDELPNYGPGGGGDYGTSGYVPPARPAVKRDAPDRPALTYTPTNLPPATYTPPAPTFTPQAMTSYTAPVQPPQLPEVSRFAASTDPSSSASPPEADPNAASPPSPPATALRPMAPPRGAVIGPEGFVGPAPSDGYVQPIGYAVRSFARGALPPQGIEQFSREFRATLTDVWNFYSYWTRFQTDDLVQMGRQALDSALSTVPGWNGSSTTSGSTVRRIKVTGANGENGGTKGNRVATTTTVDPPPVPTPAAPPAPPAPTARFSPTVTADDAEIPPGGRDTSAAAKPDPVAEEPPKKPDEKQ